MGGKRRKKRRRKRLLQRLGDLTISIEIIINAISYRFGHKDTPPPRSSNHNTRIVSAATTWSSLCSPRGGPKRINNNSDNNKKENQTQTKFPPLLLSPTSHFAPPVVNSFQTAAKFVLIKLHPHRSFTPIKLMG